MNGILIIDKAPDWTSNDVVSKLRGVLHERRIGHGGTLDPMATGVLPVFAGRATRAVEFCESFDKEYIASVRLGITTDTQDTTGAVLSESDNCMAETVPEEILSGFRGDIMQVPPMYSAVKVGGKKLYELARRGVEIERKARPVTIRLLEQIGAEDAEKYGFERCGDLFLRVVCSKGTYIRTLIHDIGQALGCGAAMSGLRRVRAGAFGLERAVTIDDVIRAAGSGEAESLLMPVDSLFSDYDSVFIDGGREKKCRNGNVFKIEAPDGKYRVYSQDGGFLMLGECSRGIMSTVKSFFEV